MTNEKWNEIGLCVGGFFDFLIVADGDGFWIRARVIEMNAGAANTCAPEIRVEVLKVDNSSRLSPPWVERHVVIKPEWVAQVVIPNRTLAAHPW